MINTEIRVRPVIRHVVTRFPGNRGPGPETLGEFDSEAAAEELAGALRSSMQRPKQYIVVQRSFDVDVKAYYAEELAQAECYKDELQAHYGHEFRIFEREVTDPVMVAQMAVTPAGSWSPLNLPALANPSPPGRNG